MEDTIPWSQEMWFKWVDGSTITWANWAANEPNSQGCVFIDPTQGRWADVSCYDVLGAYFCSVPATLQPKDTLTTSKTAGCPLISEQLPGSAFEAYCYYFDLMTSPFDDAEAQCERYGGNLASIYSE